MALIIDPSSPAVVVGSGTVLTASFTPPDDSLLVVMMAANSVQNFNPITPIATDTLGVHATYTLSDWFSEADNSSISGQCALWTAPITTGAAMQVSVTVDPSNPDVAVKVFVLTGQDLTTPIGATGKSGSTSASSIAQSYVGEATSGQGFLVTCDWDALGNPTAGSGCSINAGTIGGQISYGFARRTVADDTLGASNTLNVTTPSNSTNLSWCWLEILPVAVDENLVDPPPFLVCPPPGRFTPTRGFTPWMGADTAPSQLISMRVTATETGVTNNGMSLSVKMLTGAAAVQNGASNSSTSITTPSLAVTPNATASLVYGAIINANSTTVWTALANTTFAINFSDATNGAVYGNYRSTGSTVASSSITLGASAPTGAASGGIAEAEILASTGLLESAASPAAVTTTSATTVSTATFTAITGALLVATVCADSGAGVVGVTVSGGGLVWVEIVKAASSPNGYAGVWMARVPGTLAQDDTQPFGALISVATRPRGAALLLSSGTADPIAVEGSPPFVLLATSQRRSVASYALLSQSPTEPPAVDAGDWPMIVAPSRRPPASYALLQQPISDPPFDAVIEPIIAAAGRPSRTSSALLASGTGEQQPAPNALLAVQTQRKASGYSILTAGFVEQVVTPTTPLLAVARNSTRGLALLASGTADPVVIADGSVAVLLSVARSAVRPLALLLAAGQPDTPIVAGDTAWPPLLAVAQAPVRGALTLLLTSAADPVIADAMVPAAIVGAPNARPRSGTLLLSMPISAETVTPVTAISVFQSMRLRPSVALLQAGAADQQNVPSLLLALTRTRATPGRLVLLAPQAIAPIVVAPNVTLVVSQRPHRPLRVLLLTGRAGPIQIITIPGILDPSGVAATLSPADRAALLVALGAGATLSAAGRDAMLDAGGETAELDAGGHV